MKLDRFERRATKELATPWVLNQHRLAMLFRNEHRAVVRLVMRVLNDELYDTTNARRFKLVILAALAMRVK